MTEAQEQFIALVRAVVCTGSAPADTRIRDPKALYDLAKLHDMAHIAGYAVRKYELSGIDDATADLFRQQYYTAIRRVAVLEEEAAGIRKAFEENRLDFIPLKGLVLRKLYPEDWMRVSADIDILVHAKDLERAERLLVDVLGYSITASGAHHDHVTAPSGFHVDLHFTLTERETAAKPLLDEVWDRCRPVAGTRHEYAMDDEMLYLFHMFHASAHFLGGGCGVRPVLDTWLLNHGPEYDKDRRRALLEEGGLLRFAEVLESIADAWFSGGPSCDADDVMDYILAGGVYGGGQRLAAVQAREGGRGKYILYRLFPPFARMKIRYPILTRLPVLLPLCWSHRLIAAAVGKKTQTARWEMEASKRESGRAADMTRIFEKTGLL